MRGPLEKLLHDADAGVRHAAVDVLPRFAGARRMAELLSGAPDDTAVRYIDWIAYSRSDARAADRLEAFGGHSSAEVRDAVSTAARALLEDFDGDARVESRLASLVTVE